MGPEVVSRFMQKVSRSDDGCWIWQAAKNEHGYGVFSVSNRRMLAHRVSWTIAKGEIPSGLGVLHRCDTPACVRVDHLFLGTQQDNMNDCVRKQRTGAARGEKSGKAKLSSSQVSEIRRLGMDGLSHREIGRRFGVGKTTIGTILRRETWKENA